MENRHPPRAILRAAAPPRHRTRYRRTMPETIRLTVNGVARASDADPATPLLYVLRNDFGLKAAKFGCGLGQCGACTVLIDGRARQSCDVPLWEAAGKAVTTLEGLAATRHGAALARAFVAEQAAQCGYCIPGVLVSAAALLERNAAPGEADIRGALARNLCRCGTHARILRAIRRAAKDAAGPSAA
jgi:aerobic-type carbon monoxide dehydrogenase small subunit (CoxS/CutS family)